VEDGSCAGAIREIEKPIKTNNPAANRGDNFVPMHDLPICICCSQSRTRIGLLSINYAGMKFG
jgi:hypothetical protein